MIILLNKQLLKIYKNTFENQIIQKETLLIKN